MGINDAVAAVGLADSVALGIEVSAASAASVAATAAAAAGTTAGAGTISTASYLWSCVTGPGDPACDVALALIAYTIVNDIISLALDFFGDSSSFHGSLRPRPVVLNQADILRTLGVPINGSNLDRLTHRHPSPALP